MEENVVLLLLVGNYSPSCQILSNLDSMVLQLLTNVQRWLGFSFSQSFLSCFWVVGEDPVSVLVISTYIRGWWRNHGHPSSFIQVLFLCHLAASVILMTASCMGWNGSQGSGQAVLPPPPPELQVAGKALSCFACIFTKCHQRIPSKISAANCLYERHNTDNTLWSSELALTWQRWWPSMGKAWESGVT